MSDIIQIQILQLIAAYVFVFILLIIVNRKHIGHENEIILASIRMTIQLILVGYILDYIFANQNMFYTLLILAIMEVFAIRNIYGRINEGLSRKLKQIIAISMVSGTVFSIMYFMLVVINLKPWYLSQYFIPISGMLIGNSMTGISLGVDRLINGIKDNLDRVETALMLGATPEKATRDIVNQAFYAAILPTINSMMGMGIIFLPGMMTGQILSGTSPLIAIKYQIAIMLGILGSVTLTVFIMVQWGYKTFFNDRMQVEID